MLNVQTFVVGMVSTNCYIVCDAETRAAAVIDPGDRAEVILSLIREKALTVDYIFLTHGHFDHVLALDEVRRATGAKSVVHGLEGVEADILIRGGETFPLGGHTVEALHTPGHTPGSVCYRVKDILFTGDTLFEDDCGRCDLPGGDYGVMLESLRRLAALDGDYTVYPGHDVSTTLSRERAHNVNMREALL
ncbi:MAG: MBL fold metallo-hydrolase [Oscillospiraceae bacterium]|nr:MBL fold metallo-hydrolase [Oscillospiraceae bacterium]